MKNKTVSAFKMAHLMPQNRLLSLRGSTPSLTELMARGDPVVKTEVLHIAYIPVDGKQD